ncbi:MAG: hypothetical protein WD273_01755 [Trueperaceae bacterium]
MTTSTSARSEAQGSPTWVLWLFGIALVVLFIWLWNTANSAKSTAEANAALLAQPQVELDYLVGGPTRFPEEFQEAAEDAEIENFASEEFLWTTALISNEGLGEVQDITLTVDLPSGAEPTVLASLPSFGSSVDVEPAEGGLEIDLRDIGDGETAMVFLGYDRGAVPEEVSVNWARSYEALLGSLTVEADDVEETLFGRGV